VEIYVKGETGSKGEKRKVHIMTLTSGWGGQSSKAMILPRQHWKGIRQRKSLKTVGKAWIVLELFVFDTPTAPAVRTTPTSTPNQQYVHLNSYNIMHAFITLSASKDFLMGWPNRDSKNPRVAHQNIHGKKVVICIYINIYFFFYTYLIYFICHLQIKLHFWIKFVKLVLHTLLNELKEKKMFLAIAVLHL